MLSDGVEAAVRANVQSGRISTGAQSVVPAAQDPTVTPGRKPLTIQDVVNKIIDDRIRDGQLDECDLTLKDIEELRHLFVEILAGIYHPRIVYPDPVRPVTTPETAKQETSTQPEEVVRVAVREIPLEALVGATSVIAVATTDEPATPALAEQSPRLASIIWQNLGLVERVARCKSLPQTIWPNHLSLCPLKKPASPGLRLDSCS